MLRLVYDVRVAKVAKDVKSNFSVLGSSVYYC